MSNAAKLNMNISDAQEEFKFRCEELEQILLSELEKLLNFTEGVIYLNFRSNQLSLYMEIEKDLYEDGKLWRIKPAYKDVFEAVFHNKGWNPSIRWQNPGEGFFTIRLEKRNDNPDLLKKEFKLRCEELEQILLSELESGLNYVEDQHLTITSTQLSLYLEIDKDIHEYGKSWRIKPAYEDVFEAVFHNRGWKPIIHWQYPGEEFFTIVLEKRNDMPDLLNNMQKIAEEIEHEKPKNTALHIPGLNAIQVLNGFGSKEYATAIRERIDEIILLLTGDETNIRLMGELDGLRFALNLAEIPKDFPETKESVGGTKYNCPSPVTIYKSHSVSEVYTSTPVEDGQSGTA